MFDFDLIDDVLFEASTLATVELATALSTRHRNCAPAALVEYAFLSMQSKNSHWPTITALGLNGSDALTTAQKTGALDGTPAVLQPMPYEFVRPPSTASHRRDPKWAAFLKRLQVAAAQIVGEKVSHGVTGSFLELQSNAFEHSQRQLTTIVGYGFEPSHCFSLFVCDAGEGILNSLRRNAAYEGLSDSAEALSQALVDGVSRYADETRGYGFRQVLRNLEFHGCSIRFRSGSSRLVMDGPDNRFLGQAADFQGFFCALTFKT